MSVFDQFDRVRIVNLPERQDRRAEMTRELHDIGVPVGKKVQFHNARRMKDAGPFRRLGSHGNYLSQLAILEEALAAGESVLILEDDCQFLESAKTYECPPGTDIFYGGFYKLSDHADLGEADVMGSHFMAFSVPVIEKLVPFLRSLLDLETPIDPAVVRSDFDPAVRPSIDGAYIWFRRYHPEFATSFERLAIQRASASDVAERKWFDRVPGLRRLANRARRVKERLG